jgi:hypothetical protein
MPASPVASQLLNHMIIFADRGRGFAKTTTLIQGNIGEADRICRCQMSVVGHPKKSIVWDVDLGWRYGEGKQGDRTSD